MKSLRRPCHLIHAISLGLLLCAGNWSQASSLDPSRAVSVKNVSLNAGGLARLRLDEGMVLPAAAVGGKTEELVFLGKGRITLDPPDDIEAGQLELFIGEPRLDEEVSEIVLVLGSDAAVEALLRRPPVAALDPAQLRRGEEIFEKWRRSAERKAMNVDGAILMDTAGDPLYQGYFAGWFHGRVQGMEAAAAGRPAEAEAFFRRALEAEVESPAAADAASDRQEMKREGRFLDAMVQLQLARLALDQGKDEAAQDAFDQANKVLRGFVRFTEELQVTESRLDLRHGDFDRAFKRLRKGLLRRQTLEGTESYVLLAIAAQATRHQEELEQAVKAARDNGADLALLDAPRP